MTMKSIPKMFRKAALLAALLSATSAFADPDPVPVLWDFTYASNNGGNTKASGVLTTLDQGDGRFLITGITGQRNGIAFGNLIAPGSSATHNDNLLFARGRQLTAGGFSVEFARHELNISYQTSFSQLGGYTGYVDTLVRAGLGPISFTATRQVSPIPEPAEALLLSLGLAGLAAAARRRRPT